MKRVKLFDLSETLNWENFKLNPCPICGRLPVAFVEPRYEKTIFYKKNIFIGRYILIQCNHFHRKIKTEKKCETILPRDLLDAISKWNKIT